MTAPPATAPDGTRPGLLAAALAAVLLSLLLLSPHRIELPDGEKRFDAVEDLVLEARLSNTRYPLLGPVFAAPLYITGLFVATPRFLCERYNFLLLVGLLAGLSRLLRGHLPRKALAGLLLALAGASMLPNQQTTFFGEMFTVALAATALAALATDRPRVGWSLLVLSVANAPATIGGVALAALAESWRTRRLRFLLAVPAALVLPALENALKRGSPFRTGYEGDLGFQTILPTSGHPGFSYPFALGVLGILFSFGKGLLWFAPGLLLPVPKERSEEVRLFHRLSLLYLAGLVVVYAKWWAWYGGWSWGPRFFLFASVPAALTLACHAALPTGSSPARALALGALALSTWVGVSGAAFGLRGLEFAAADGWKREFLVWHVPEFSVLWHPLVAPVPFTAAGASCAVVLAAAGAILAWPLLASLARDGANGAASLVRRLR